MNKEQVFLEIDEIISNYHGFDIGLLDKESENLIKQKIELAINYTRCCKSDSEQLIAFSDWVFEQPLHLGGNERKLVKQYLEGNNMFYNVYG